MEGKESTQVVLEDFNEVWSFESIFHDKVDMAEKTKLESTTKRTHHLFEKIWGHESLLAECFTMKERRTDNTRRKPGSHC